MSRRVIRLVGSSASFALPAVFSFCLASETLRGDPAFNEQAEICRQAGEVCEVADETAQRPWKLFDECRGRHNLVFARETRLLINVDHLQSAGALQMPAA